MASIKLTLVLLSCLVALVCSAPTDPEATSTTTTTTAAPASASPDPSSTSPAQTSAQDPSATSSTTPSTGDSSTNNYLAVGSAQDADQLKNKISSFTCAGRLAGYYADIEQACRIYHFCMPGEYNGEPIFQRVSYLCLNDTIFDQQALDCVAPSNTTTPCANSPTYYEESNQVLRQAISSHETHQGSNDTTTSAPTTAKDSENVIST